jgi:ABC-2 type transport system ATP-binding protein
MIFSCQNLTKYYGGHRALDDVSFQVDRGQVYGLLGPNGSGKTTLLGLALGVLTSSRGHCEWFGRDSSDFSVRRKIGSLLEKPRTYPYWTAWQNLKLTVALRGVSLSEIDRVLALVNLSDQAHLLVSSYSLGMKQRLAIAATLIGDPEVLVLDEPTNGVDAEGVAEIRRLIIGQRSKGKTVLLASHHLDEVEKVCTHVAVLKEGRLLTHGSIDAVLKNRNWWEVRGSLSEELYHQLNTWSGVLSVERMGSHWQVVLKDPLGGDDLNRFCFDKGVALSSLVERRQTLEEHFLEVLRR